jgi:hypothetical protein
MMIAKYLLKKPAALCNNTIDEKVFLKRQGLFAFKRERGLWNLQ